MFACSSNRTELEGWYLQHHRSYFINNIHFEYHHLIFFILQGW